MKSLKGLACYAVIKDVLDAEGLILVNKVDFERKKEILRFVPGCLLECSCTDCPAFGIHDNTYWDWHYCVDISSCCTCLSDEWLCDKHNNGLFTDINVDGKGDVSVCKKCLALHRQGQPLYLN